MGAYFGKRGEEATPKNTTEQTPVTPVTPVIKPEAPGIEREKPIEFSTLADDLGSVLFCQKDGELANVWSCEGSGYPRYRSQSSKAAVQLSTETRDVRVPLSAGDVLTKLPLNVGFSDGAGNPAVRQIHANLRTICKPGEAPMRSEIHKISGLADTVFAKLSLYSGDAGCTPSCQLRIQQVAIAFKLKDVALADCRGKSMTGTLADSMELYSKEIFMGPWMELSIQSASGSTLVRETTLKPAPPGVIDLDDAVDLEGQAFTVSCDKVNISVKSSKHLSPIDDRNELNLETLQSTIERAAAEVTKAVQHPRTWETCYVSVGSRHEEEMVAWSSKACEILDSKSLRRESSQPLLEKVHELRDCVEKFVASERKVREFGIPAKAPDERLLVLREVFQMMQKGDDAFGVKAEELLDAELLQILRDLALNRKTLGSIMDKLQLGSEAHDMVEKWMFEKGVKHESEIWKQDVADDFQKACKLKDFEVKRLQDVLCQQQTLDSIMDKLQLGPEAHDMVEKWMSEKGVKHESEFWKQDMANDFHKACKLKDLEVKRLQDVLSKNQDLEDRVKTVEDFRDVLRSHREENPIAVLQRSLSEGDSNMVSSEVLDKAKALLEECEKLELPTDDAGWIKEGKKVVEETKETVGELKRLKVQMQGSDGQQGAAPRDGEVCEPVQQKAKKVKGLGDPNLTFSSAVDPLGQRQSPRDTLVDAGSSAGGVGGGAVADVNGEDKSVILADASAEDDQTSTGTRQTPRDQPDANSHQAVQIGLPKKDNPSPATVQRSATQQSIHEEELPEAPGPKASSEDVPLPPGPAPAWGTMTSFSEAHAPAKDDSALEPTPIPEVAIQRDGQQCEETYEGLVGALVEEVKQALKKAEEAPEALSGPDLAKKEKSTHDMPPVAALPEDRDNKEVAPPVKDADLAFKTLNELRAWFSQYIAAMDKKVDNLARQVAMGGGSQSLSHLGADGDHLNTTGQSFFQPGGKESGASFNVTGGLLSVTGGLAPSPSPCPSEMGDAAHSTLHDDLIGTWHGGKEVGAHAEDGQQLAMYVIGRDEGADFYTFESFEQNRKNKGVLYAEGDYLVGRLQSTLNTGEDNGQVRVHRNPGVRKNDIKKSILLQFRNHEEEEWSGNTVAQEDGEKADWPPKRDEPPRGMRLAMEREAPSMRGVYCFVRFRPPLSGQEDEPTVRHDVKYGEDNHCTLTWSKSKKDDGEIDNKAQNFRYDDVALEDKSQNDIFSLVEILPEKVIDNFSAAVLNYGGTGSGKTFTMKGSMKDQGIALQMSNRLLELIRQKKAWAVQNKAVAEIELDLQIMEVYNEKCFDLLNRSSKSVEVKTLPENYPERGMPERVEILNLRTQPVDSVKTVHDAIEEAFRVRHTAATLGNSESSRSHAIIIFRIKGRVVQGSTTKKLDSKLYLVDLAGCESIKHAALSAKERKEITKRVGISAAEKKIQEKENALQEEMRKINLSLNTLQTIIRDTVAAGKSKEKLAGIKSKTRDSKLTLILRDCFGAGNFITLLCCVSPLVKDSAPTLTTLQFGDVFQKMHNRVEASRDIDVDWKQVANNLFRGLAQVQNKMLQYFLSPMSLTFKESFDRAQGALTDANTAYRFPSLPAEELIDVVKSAVKDCCVVQADSLPQTWCVAGMDAASKPGGPRKLKVEVQLKPGTQLTNESGLKAKVQSQCNEVLKNKKVDVPTTVVEVQTRRMDSLDAEMLVQVNALPPQPDVILRFKDS